MIHFHHFKFVAQMPADEYSFFIDNRSIFLLIMTMMIVYGLESEISMNLFIDVMILLEFNSFIHPFIHFLSH